MELQYAIVRSYGAFLVGKDAENELHALFSQNPNEINQMLCELQANQEIQNRIRENMKRVSQNWKQKKTLKISGDSISKIADLLDLIDLFGELNFFKYHKFNETKDCCYYQIFNTKNDSLPEALIFARNSHKRFLVTQIFSQDQLIFAMNTIGIPKNMVEKIKKDLSFFPKNSKELPVIFPSEVAYLLCYTNEMLQTLPSYYNTDISN